MRSGEVIDISYIEIVEPSGGLLSHRDIFQGYASYRRSNY